MVKFQSFLLILASFLTTVVPSALTAPNYVISAASEWALCKKTSPSLMELAVNKSDHAISLVKDLGTVYLNELDKDFNDEMEGIHSFQTEWNVVTDALKFPNEPTSPKFLDTMNEKDTLEKIFRYLHAVHKGVKERKRESTDLGIEGNKVMFHDLMGALDKVIEDFKKILPMFKASLKNYEVPPKHPKRSKNLDEHNFRNIIILHDYLIVVEFTNDVAKRLLKTYCGPPE